MMLDMSLLIPIAASLLAVTLVIVVVCIWVLKAKSRRNLERAIQEDKRFIYAAASQRYVDIDKTRSLPAYHDPALIHFPQPYATVLMGDDICEDPNEMKSFLPQNMKDRPLPKPGTLKNKETETPTSTTVHNESSLLNTFSVQVVLSRFQCCILKSTFLETHVFS
ncbi:uncharacterized protein CEXT_337781 [Caerostris extrusa]|uniref:Uncharacterized protein n=1 Tax=Caerostris extrusa TaxID=172846 RepID=A0AAV4QH57_CAEEX|nr:uncharacterized protein CEXT_337781 [Caerostris extrusa]